VRDPERRSTARPRQAAVEGVVAYLADEDAVLYNLTDTAIKEDVLAAALSLTALAADAVTALAAATGREPGDVLRSLGQPTVEQPTPSPDPADRGGDLLSGVLVVYPDPMDDYDWAMTEAKGWIELAVGWAGGQEAITFYDPTRLAQEVQGAMAQPGYFVERALVVVPTVTRGAIESAVAAMARRGFVDVGLRRRPQTSE
jgi:hypothetical protein